MAAALVTLVLALAIVFPLQARAQLGPGCGPAGIKFDVTTAKHGPAAPSLDATKSRIYFLQDDLEFNSRPRPTVRFGVDGKWVGATHSNSYFYISVDPGEHDICANWQSFVGLGTQRSTAAAHFTAEAGKTYYFRAQNVTKMDHSGGEHDTEYVRLAEIVLQPLDPDEAQVIMHSFSLSSSHPKK